MAPFPPTLPFSCHLEQSVVSLRGKVQLPALILKQYGPLWGNWCAMQGSVSHKTHPWHCDSAQSVIDRAADQDGQRGRAGLLASACSLPPLHPVVKYYDPFLLHESLLWCVRPKRNSL